MSLDLPSLDLTDLQWENLHTSIHPNAEYNATHDAMLARILARIDDKTAQAAAKNTHTTPDELWLVEHQDVYTLGQAGKQEHILYQTGTPIIKTDRGGQVTWHGTGQLVAYWLFDLHALGLGVRDLVSHAEQAIEDVVGEYLPDTLIAKARRDAPGVYIYNTDGDMLGKIASLGFKIKQGFSYHGVAINLTNDLSAFNAINPCGYAGMQMVKLSSFGKFQAEQTHEFIRKFAQNIQMRHKGQIALRTI
ncbi:lipoyl(octanoyl) transferase [Moraxella caviae]|uniref:Octanoyltransferase n=1 Tax=Moraxella caviae TaxID=34060 RepID=A0A1T0A2I6_9GAMM|nr:lipoyl(octanoyl) transferase [Moraxella caviae]